MGINASPTCVMAYDGAVGYLIGEPNQGMRYMFKMMNNARVSVGVSGLSLGERAYQDAVAYAHERRQGRAPGAPAGESSPIVDHPDVRRMLLTMRAQIEALRCLAYLNAESIDLAARHPDEAVRTWRGRAGRPAHPDDQGLGHRRRRRADLARRCRSTAAWATSRRPASPSTTATSASPRSTRARTASRRWTWSGASCRCGPVASMADFLAGIEATAGELSGAGGALASDRQAPRRRPRGAAADHRLAAGQRPRRPQQRARRRDALPADVRHRHRGLAARPLGAGGASATLDAGEGDAAFLAPEGRDRPLLRRAAAARRRRVWRPAVTAGPADLQASVF